MLVHKNNLNYNLYYYLSTHMEAHPANLNAYIYCVAT